MHSCLLSPEILIHIDLLEGQGAGGVNNLSGSVINRARWKRGWLERSRVTKSSSAEDTRTHTLPQSQWQ